MEKSHELCLRRLKKLQQALNQLQAKKLMDNFTLAVESKDKDEMTNILQQADLPDEIQKAILVIAQDQKLMMRW